MLEKKYLDLKRMIKHNNDSQKKDFTMFIMHMLMVKKTFILSRKYHYSRLERFNAKR